MCIRDRYKPEKSISYLKHHLLSDLYYWVSFVLMTVRHLSGASFLESTFCEYSRRTYKIERFLWQSSIPDKHIRRNFSHKTQPARFQKTALNLVQRWPRNELCERRSSPQSDTPWRRHREYDLNNTKAGLIPLFPPWSLFCDLNEFISSYPAIQSFL